MDDLEFVASIEERIKAVEALALLSQSEERELRLCAIVRARDAAIRTLEDDLGIVACAVCNRIVACVDQGLAPPCPWCQAEAFRVRLAKHEACAEELRAANSADGSADAPMGGDYARGRGGVMSEQKELAPHEGESLPCKCGHSAWDHWLLQGECDHRGQCKCGKFDRQKAKP